MILLPAKWVLFDGRWELLVDGVSVCEVQRSRGLYQPLRYGDEDEPPAQRSLAAAKRAVEKALKARRT